MWLGMRGYGNNKRWKPSGGRYFPPEGDEIFFSGVALNELACLTDVELAFFTDTDPLSPAELAFLTKILYFILGVNLVQIRHDDHYHYVVTALRVGRRRRRKRLWSTKRWRFASYYISSPTPPPDRN
jgi:hypothetical protein